ncbi:hypothetical protein SPRG_14240 [Saprolegnia parasitica CBS 223.65]|uniref:Uncharacterized protein n=1 Tax=Saprolegnia parasitica (strain CBS 223.65) TaxID=695850 RepID=A0A067BNB4_SAPPC|nr:hypothetical protein SPRG_14240 [Saprolegnia parasitica CBS 223.65]KDO19713.1 hypothetical protein SPRG_14240 [Saprolegnia parasitica CBS 223.65]|eukprot:XP_012209572.1 hypothetical protein SPRG_14240 [Saprolegnia parasitica CBS 223.65]
MRTTAVHERRRTRDREAKRKAREQHKRDVAALVASIAELREAASVLQGTQLSWQDVALALRTSTQSSVLENKALRAELVTTSSLVRELQAWVDATASIPAAPPRLAEASWRDAYLPMEPRTRQLGYIWIAQQLDHAANERLHPALFPHTLEDSIRVEWSRLSRKLVMQKIVTASTHEAAKALWLVNRATPECHLYPNFLVSSDVESLHHEMNAESEMSYVRELCNGRSVNVLHRRVTIDDERVLVAYRSIRHDDLFASDRLDTFQEWNEVRRVSKTQCVIRTVSVLEPNEPYPSVAALLRTEYPNLYTESMTAMPPRILVETHFRRVLQVKGHALAKAYFALVDEVLASLQAPSVAE